MGTMAERSRAEPQRPTLRDVARVAAVSVSTASMALRDDTRIAQATRARVRDAASLLRYVPDSQARSLRVRRTGNVGLVIPHSSEHVFSHQYFLALLDGIVARSNEGEAMLVLSVSPREDDERTPYLRILHGRAVDGVIVASASPRDRNVLQLASSGYPAVFIGRYPDSASVDAVGVDDHAGALAATDHVIDVHHRRRVGYLRGPQNALSASDRLDGYRTSLARHGIPYREDLVVQADYDQAAGTAACERLISSAVPFDALVTANDDSALGAMRALRRAGLRVPQDVALVGFDDAPLASVVTPSLTTIHQPVRQLGYAATTRLIELIAADEPLPAQQSILPVGLVIRASCGCDG